MSNKKVCFAPTPCSGCPQIVTLPACPQNCPQPVTRPSCIPCAQAQPQSQSQTLLLPVSSCSGKSIIKNYRFYSSFSLKFYKILTYGKSKGCGVQPCQGCPLTTTPGPCLPGCPIPTTPPPCQVCPGLSNQGCPAAGLTNCFATKSLCFTDLMCPLGTKCCQVDCVRQCISKLLFV
jgi:hypothetical protein